MSKIIGEINLIVAYLELIDDRIDLVEELCTSRRDIEKKKFNLIKDRFSKAKEVLGNKEFMKELYLTDLRVEAGKSVKEILWQSFEKKLPEQMRKCEEVIQSGTLSKGSLECFKQLCPLLLIAKVDQLYHSQLYSWDASKFRSTEYPHPSADAVESLKDLAVLVHVEEICYILKKLADFGLVKNLKDIILFAECLKDRHWSYDVTSTIEIPGDNPIDRLFYLYRLYESVEELHSIDNFVLLLSVTTEVLKSEELNMRCLNDYIPVFGKLCKRAFEKLEKDFDKLKDGLRDYLSAALKVSQTLNIDKEMDFHTYIANKLISSGIGATDFKEFARLYKVVVDSLAEEEYGRRYIFPLLRLIAIATIQQKFYYGLRRLMKQEFILVLLKIVEATNKDCTQRAINNFDKLLNYSVYLSDLEYLEGFVDYLYTLYLQDNKEGFENALKRLDILGV